MAFLSDYFDKNNLLKIIGRKLKEIAKNKNITLTKWSEKGIGYSQGDLSRILNGQKGVSHDKLVQIAGAIGVNEKELKEIVKESKIDELKIYFGVDFDNIGEEKELSVDEIFDILAEKFGFNEDEKEDLKGMAEYKKIKKEKNSKSK